MAINLSRFHGIPTKLEGAKKQFIKIYNEEKNRSFNKGGYLVLKKETSGPYKGYWGTYFYSTKPKGRFILKKKFN